VVMGVWMKMAMQLFGSAAGWRWCGLYMGSEQWVVAAGLM